eukprot:ANDGO_01556.mRNA.1 putative U3 small nucleolar RNA-associated protein 7
MESNQPDVLSSKYMRDPRVFSSTKRLKTYDKKANRLLGEARNDISRAVSSMEASEMMLTGSAGFLEADTDVEQTHRFSQAAISSIVNVETARKAAFSLSLPYGPYRMAYSTNGRSAVMAGMQGHVAIVQWKQAKLIKEWLPAATDADVCRDAVFLHDESHVAIAQRKYVYVYDDQGVELHKLGDHIDVTRMQFLPYHFLLSTLSRTGYVKWVDVSTGQLVASHRTRLGESHTFGLNPHNAVVAVGHVGGSVSMWAPSLGTPLLKMHCHKAPVLSIAFDPRGNTMVTGGGDGVVRIWDLRNSYRPLASYHCYTSSSSNAIKAKDAGEIGVARGSGVPVSLAVSQKGMLAVGIAQPNQSSRIEIWKPEAIGYHSTDTSSAPFLVKPAAPYMAHTLEHRLQVSNVCFAPYEDILGYSHTKGVGSMIVPGSGEPNFDSYVANPFETRDQAREALVHKLLDKIAPDMITLDPTFVGSVSSDAKKFEKQDRKEAEEDDRKKRLAKRKETKKMKGRNRPTALHNSAQRERFERVKESLQERKRMREEEAVSGAQGEAAMSSKPSGKKYKAAEVVQVANPDSSENGTKQIKSVLARFNIGHKQQQKRLRNGRRK